MDADRDVELLGQREIGCVAWIVGAMPAVLDRHLAQHRQLAGRMQRAQFGDRFVLALAEADAGEDQVRCGLAPVGDQLDRSFGHRTPHVVPTQRGDGAVAQARIVRGCEHRLVAGHEFCEVQRFARIDGRDQHLLVTRAGRGAGWQFVHRKGVQVHVDHGLHAGWLGGDACQRNAEQQAADKTLHARILDKPLRVYAIGRKARPAPRSSVMATVCAVRPSQ